MIADKASDLIRGRTALEAVVVGSLRLLGARIHIGARLCNIVHSGTTRVAGNDDNTDFHTVALTERSLRPGTVYADPFRTCCEGCCEASREEQAVDAWLRGL
jgi:hypothetical protein